jgi:hypothetical protein
MVEHKDRQEKMKGGMKRADKGCSELVAPVSKKKRLVYQCLAEIKCQQAPGPKGHRVRAESCH